MLDEDTPEYRALWWVIRIAVSYFAAVQVLAFVILGCYAALRPAAAALVAANGTNPWWWAAFHAVSAFNNCGLSTFRDSMVQWGHDRLVMLVCAALIILGNTGYPIAMRLLVWALHRARPADKSLKFLLDHPRRCFTHMFADGQTRMLLALIFAATGVEFALFMWLDYGAAFLAGYDPSTRALLGFFQSVSTRVCGLTAIDLLHMAPSMQASERRRRGGVSRNAVTQ
jgi:Trk-type K+ transport system membrane component